SRAAASAIVSMDALIESAHNRNRRRP
ncbi:MAG: hypothetical protein JWP39_3701, partial [Jatrophihabitans sp.]|nr:hypothetical protein [Jatrophihabitans sp.]